MKEYGDWINRDVLMTIHPIITVPKGDLCFLFTEKDNTRKVKCHYQQRSPIMSSRRSWFCELFQIELKAKESVASKCTECLKMSKGEINDQ